MVKSRKTTTDEAPAAPATDAAEKAGSDAELDEAIPEDVDMGASDDEGSDCDYELAENVCPLCEQTYGAEDEDL